MLTGLEFYKTADVLDIPGMEIVINGANIDLGQIDWDAGAGKTTARKNDTLDIIRGHPSNLPAKPGSEKQNSAKTRKYRKVQKSQLSRYIGKNIQVETSIGKRE